MSSLSASVSVSSSFVNNNASKKNYASEMRARVFNNTLSQLLSQNICSYPYCGNVIHVNDNLTPSCKTAGTCSMKCYFDKKDEMHWVEFMMKNV